MSLLVTTPSILRAGSLNYIAEVTIIIVARGG